VAGDWEMGNGCCSGKLSNLMPGSTGHSRVRISDAEVKVKRKAQRAGGRRESEDSRTSFLCVLFFPLHSFPGGMKTQDFHRLVSSVQTISKKTKNA